MAHSKMSLVGLVGLLLVAAATAAPGDVIQVDVTGVFNANVIVACREDKIIPAEQADNAGYSFISQSAAAKLHKEEPAGLPDDGHFAANDRHPEVQLAYMNARAGKNVRRSAPGDDKFDFAVPERKYAQMQLFATAGNRATAIKVTLTYADGSAEQRGLEVTDWCVGVTQTDDDRFILIGGRDRIHPDGKNYEHYGIAMIYGINLNPDKNKVLTRITVEKSGGDSTLCFFGATGQTAAPATQPGN